MKSTQSEFPFLKINSIILQNGTNFERPFTRQKTRRNFGRIGRLLRWLRRIGKTDQHPMFQCRQSKHQFLTEIPQKNRLGKGKSGKFVSLRFETEEEKRFALNFKEIFSPNPKGRNFIKITPI